VYPVGVFGLFNIRKPAGPTSHDVLDIVRRRLPHGTKAGHAGTLDPFAEGVLVICAGPAVRLASYVQQQPKTYLAEAVLGATSTTDDPTGQITPASGILAQGPRRSTTQPGGAPQSDVSCRGPATPPDEREVRSVLKEFEGEILQVPPVFSAVHLDGKRAYKLARAGKCPSLTARAVTVHAINTVQYDYPRLELEVTCGAGTYIRALARDIGRRLGTGGYCAKLIRTRVGPFRIDESVWPDELDPLRHLLPPLLALGHLARIELDPHACRALAMGRHVALPVCLDTLRLPVGPDSAQPGRAAELAVVNREGELVAIAKLVPPSGTIRATRVFAR